MSLRNARCDGCREWRRTSLIGGECWSFERLDGDLSKGPADITYPGSMCEAFIRRNA